MHGRSFGRNEKWMIAEGSCWSVVSRHPPAPRRAVLHEELEVERRKMNVELVTTVCVLRCCDLWVK